MTELFNMTREELIDTINELREENKAMESDVLILRGLQYAGVDNWQGYADAMEITNELEANDE